MWKFLAVAAAAVLFGTMSAFLEAADDGLVLRTVFSGCPSKQIYCSCQAVNWRC